jgi:hypothetical protein
MNGPPSSGHDTSWGSSETRHVCASTGPRARNRGRIRSAVSGTPRYRHGRRASAPGSVRSSTSLRTAASVSLNMNRARSSVPNRLLTIGNLHPITFEKSSAGPPAW